MEYIYAAMLLHATGKEINEENVKKVLEAAGAEVDDARVKALIAALEEVDIEEAMETSTITAAAPSGAAEEEKEEKEEEKNEQMEKLKTALEAKRVILEINPNKAFAWLWNPAGLRRFPWEKAFAFNYIHWLVLLPGILALFFLPGAKGITGAAGSFFLSRLVYRIKALTLRQGIIEIIASDPISLAALYSRGAIKFYCRSEKKKTVIAYPQPWEKVLDHLEPL